ncbi:MAG: hypothetical protein II276_03470 [Bacteroidales bacterium]|nr:hypothetical protein [Bacteroidales bacterium]MBQ1938368.1 hypothetical protein [Bacteroidales bacterium]MBQ2452502.1 hypothetical protein [Bacteroidales bacterium]
MRARFSPVLILLAALITLSLVSSCVGLNTVKNLKVESCRLAGVQMPSFSSRTLNATLLLGVDNPGAYLRLNDISGVIYARETSEHLMSFTLGDFAIDKKARKEYPVQIALTPSPEMSFMKIISLLKNHSFGDCVFDIQFRMSGSPTAKGAKYSFKNQALDKLLPAK